jgi:predicted AAA+ superfamily ATPase
MLARLITSRINSTFSSILLTGPRQVGKSTLLRSLKPDLEVNLADQGVFIRHSKDPELIRKLVLALPKGSTILLDEAQRLPEILNTIQVLIDSEGYRFLVTGSSAKKLHRGKANLLPGRLISEYLDPLSYLEVGKDNFDLARALRFGMLPGIFLNKDEGGRILDSYVDLYLREEIQAEGLVRSLGSYARFLELVAITSGQWLNYSKISSDSEIPKETIRNFTSVLEETLLLFRISSFQISKKFTQKSQTRKVQQKEKVLLFDVGVRNSLLRIGGNEVPLHDVGSVFEQWMILQIIYLNRALNKKWKVSSFLDSNGLEVDCVIETENELLGIEIKSGTKYRSDWIVGLNCFVEYVGTVKPVKKFIAYTGDDVQKLDDQTMVYPYSLLLEVLFQY